MKKNLTEIVFILDRSGSMAGLEADTIGGFNAMIEKQKRENVVFDIQGLLNSITMGIKNIGGQTMDYGYVRVSTQEQNTQRQLIALAEFGICEKQIYIDKQSGKDFQRQGYQRLIRKIKSGDTVVIKSIDRLGRNYEEILQQWRIITKEKGAYIIVLDMPLLNTRKEKDLTGTLIADIVLQLLSYVAQTEREFIRQRQAEGIAAAKAQGIRFGRKPKERPGEFPQVKAQWQSGSLSARAAAQRLGITHGTFLRWAREEIG